MKKIIIILILLADAVAHAQQLSALPVATVATTNDSLIINVTNPASATKFSTKQISVGNFSQSVVSPLIKTATNSLARIDTGDYPITQISGSQVAVSSFSSSPYFQIPNIPLSTGGAGGVSGYVPNWVTNLVIAFLYENDLAVPLTWTNRVISFVSVSVTGRAYFGNNGPATTITLQPGYTWISYTNSFPDMTSTNNCTKYFNLSFAGFGSPTNISAPIYIVRAHYNYLGTFNGTNY